MVGSDREVLSNRRRYCAVIWGWEVTRHFATYSIIEFR